MDPLALIGILGNFALLIPPPWGPLIAGLIKVLPLIEAGMSALAAVEKADPNLLSHLAVAADELGINLETLAKTLFAPSTLTPEEAAATGVHYHGGPKGA